MSVFFICFFFLREQGLFDNILAAAVPEGYEEQTRQAVSQTSELLIRYFIGILTQVTIITLFVSIALSILGVKNALLIGFFAGFMNIIPYLGPIFGASLGVMITISSNLDVSFYHELVPLLTKVMIVFAIIQLLDNIVLQPNIFSKSVKAHPLEIFIIVLVGAKLGGILGMVLAIPLYTVLRVVGKVFLNKFKVVQSLTRNL
jgi:predicted PurR-regulated permease PerM